MQAGHGRLHREREEEPDEQPAADALRHLDALQVAQQEAGAALRGGDRVEARDRDQHDEAAGERVDQELDGGRAALRAAVAGDQEVRRDQRRLEGDVEQQHVGGHEHEQRESLEEQREREEHRGSPASRLRVADVPLGEQHDRHQDHGHQDEDGAHAVEVERVVRADGGDPRDLLREDRALRVQDEGEDAEHRGGERDPVADELGDVSLQEEHHHRAEDRHEGQDGQKH